MLTDFGQNGILIHEESWNDNEDSVCGIQYNGSAYYFLKNQQGDVIAITDYSGNTVARYTYDAWGKLLDVTDKNGCPITSAEHIAHINPYRYRGYYYDREIGMYYLQSRYYDPEVGRFINADEAEIVGRMRPVVDYSLFAYCMNGPVNEEDFTGFGKAQAHMYAAPKCPQNIKSAIEASKLNRKWGSIYNKKGHYYSRKINLGSGFYAAEFLQTMGENYIKRSRYIVGEMTVEKWYRFLDKEYWVFKIADKVNEFLSTYNEAAGQAYGYPENALYITAAIEYITMVKPRTVRLINSKLPSLNKSNKNKKITIAFSVRNEELCYYRGWRQKKAFWHVMRSREYRA